MRRISYIIATVFALVASSFGQEVSIPDPGLNAAIREALQKPIGPLTELDLLTLINLDAHLRNITNVTGLEVARNLRGLSLSQNLLTRFSLPGTLTNLTFLDLSFNGFTNIFLPSGLGNLTNLVIQGNNVLTNLNLPSGLSALNKLNLRQNLLTSVNLPSGLGRLTRLDLSDNQLPSVTLPAGMTNLTDLFLVQNRISSISLPAELTKLSNLNLDANQLTNVTLPGTLTALTELHMAINLLSSVTLPSGLSKLATLDLAENTLTSFTLPAGLTALTNLELEVNQLTTFTVPTDATNLSTLFLFFNQLTNLSLPATLGKLTGIGLSGNRLTRLNLPSNLTALGFLNVSDNQLTNLTVPAGLTSLTSLSLSGNQLTSLTLPPDMQQLTGLFVDGNPLGALVLSEALAAANLAGTVATLRAQGIPVFTYSLTVQLTRIRQPIGAFQFVINGPPGVYAVLASSNLVTWSELGSPNNPLGSVVFTDGTAHLSAPKFYRALLQGAPVTPTNMVFIPPNTFTLGSPADEVGHQPDESPQTIVTLSHGFWMSKFLVTQRDYLTVMGSNPSGFPGNLDRPVESVSWFDATNYCAKLTEQDLAAGRIPPGSHYRLPTEAEWECAARAGTTTRFNYGDDPNVSSLTNHAWYGANSGFKPQPVGLKPPNAWGLYDMTGNVWEWCQDWYGPYPGGSQTDPQGPGSNAIGFKVIRGAAWESFELDCRSARRSIEGASPFITDFIIGFRVVLAIEP